MNDKTNENEHTYDNGFHPKEVKLKENYKFYNNNPFFVIASHIALLFTKFYIFFYKHFVLGYKIVGKKNWKAHKKGNFIICNHIHNLDCFMITTALYPHKVHTTVLQSNLGFPVFSRYIRIAGAVPIPEDRRLLRVFKEETCKAIAKGKNIIFFAEASLVPYCDHIRNFMPGAFHFAVDSNSPILPMVYTFHKPKGIRSLWRKKPFMHLNILPLYEITNLENKKETINKAMSDVHKIINDYFVEHSDYYK